MLEAPVKENIPRILSLYSILLPLVERGKTGLLHVSHWDRKEGTIGLHEGQIVHCKYGGLKGMEALNVIRNWITISVRFNDGMEAHKVDVAQGTSAILAKLQEQHYIIYQIKKAVPSPYAIFALHSDPPSETVSMSRAVWKVLSMVNGRNTVKDICVALMASEFSVSKVIYHLSVHGYIRLVAVEEPIGWERGGEFLQRLESQLALFIGPIAPFVVEDVLAEMGKSREMLDRGDMPLLVERVSHMLEDSRERVQFQEHMLRELRALQEVEST
jgi:hypothetical protein